MNFLVKETDENTIQSTIESAEDIDKKLDEFINNGLVFPSSPEGTRSIYIKESKTSKSSKKPKRKLFAADFYINNGTEE